MSTALTRPHGGKPTQGEPVIDRFFTLFRAFNGDKGAFTITELSRASSLPLSTTYCLVAQLLAWKALERREDGRVSIGLGMLEIAARTPRGQQLRRLAMPYLGQLAQATRQHVLLAVREVRDVVVMEQFSPEAEDATGYRVGRRLPLDSTAAGVVLLAYTDARPREQFVRGPAAQLPGEPAARGDLRGGRWPRSKSGPSPHRSGMRRASASRRSRSSSRTG